MLAPDFSMRVLMAYGLFLRSMNRRESRRTCLDVFQGALLKMAKSAATGQLVPCCGAGLWRCDSRATSPTYPFFLLIVPNQDFSISEHPNAFVQTF